MIRIFSTPKPTHTLVILFLVVVLGTLLLSIRYQRSEEFQKISVAQQPLQSTSLVMLSPDLTGESTNKDIESDYKKITKDLLDLNLEFKLFSDAGSTNRLSTTDFSTRVNSYSRLSLADKETINRIYLDNPEAAQALLIVALNRSLIPRLSLFTDKILTRQQAIPSKLGQSQTVKKLYETTRLALNDLRNLNSEIGQELINSNYQITDTDTLTLESGQEKLALTNIQRGIDQSLFYLKQLPEKFEQ